MNKPNTVLQDILTKLEGDKGSLIFEFNEIVTALNKEGYYFSNLHQVKGGLWRANFWRYTDSAETVKTFQYGDAGTISEAVTNAILKLKYPGSVKAGINPTSAAKIEDFLNG